MPSRRMKRKAATMSKQPYKALNRAALAVKKELGDDIERVDFRLGSYTFDLKTGESVRISVDTGGES